MLEPGGVLRSDWLKLVPAAEIVGVYPGTLYRRWRYGQLPEGACVKLDNTLYFNREALERIRSTKSANQDHQRSMESRD